MASDFVGLAALVVVTGLIHGAEPGHGWPVAAAYAFNKENVWSSGIAASVILGIGHLISSVVVVLGFFWAKSAAGLDEVPWLNYVAGGLLILLGIYEYVSGGHSHDHGHDGVHHDHGHDGDHDHDGHAHSHGHDHAHEDHLHSHDHSHSHDDHAHDHSDDHNHDHDDGGGVLARLKGILPVGGGSHDHLTEEDAQSKGLWGIAWTAFVLGFAHEEEFELIGICTGTAYCIELTLLYALCVIAALVGLTALLLAGYERYEDRMSEYAEYFPAISAAVLILMGLGFIAGIF